jgi:hypothetical protein
MSNSANILLPVGRLVLGSLYKGQDKDAEGRPLVVKTGAGAGQPRLDYFFGLAIPKGAEQHWNQTAWGQKIWEIGQRGFPNGQANAPTFAWKVTDGDSQVPNRKGNKPCDREGYRGNWVLSLSSGFAPKVYRIGASGGAELWPEADAVNLGDYVEVHANVADNGSLQQPGIYLNHNMVCFRGYGPRIVVGPNPNEVGFGASALPPGASATPAGSAFAPAPQVPAPVPVAPPQPPVVPNAAFMAPPPVRQMLPAANGVPYESYIASGWTDAQLVQHGYMAA